MDESQTKTLFCSAVLLAWLSTWAGACGDDTEPAVDAAAARDTSIAVDARAPLEASTEPLVDFSVSGCPEWSCEGQACRCIGPAPLTLRFTPVTNLEAATLKWDFGDGTTSDEPSPTHTYHGVGRFTVTLLVGGAFGILTRERKDLVELRMAHVGEVCEEDTTCLLGLCLCSDPAEFCPGPLVATCTQNCEHSECTQGVCADLGPDSDGPWRQDLCLPACFTDEDCTRPGTECLDLVSPEEGAPWVRACLPPILAALGESCADADGEPDDAACWTGRCLEIGSRGLCSGPCRPDTCPAGTACVQLGEDPEAVCLPTCTDWCPDELLECRSEGGEGKYALTFLDTSAPGDLKVCGPKQCTDDEDCLPLGACHLELGGYCLAP